MYRAPCLIKARNASISSPMSPKLVVLKAVCEVPGMQERRSEPQGLTLWWVERILSLCDTLHVVLWNFKDVGVEFTARER